MNASNNLGNFAYIRNIISVFYELHPIAHISSLTGGEWKTLYRLDTPQNSYVLSLSHPTMVEASILYEHHLLRFLHQQLPQIPAPIPTKDGSSYFVEQGRIVTLYPLMPGEMADEDKVRLPAARFLARFHQASLRYPDRSPRPGMLPWSQWDWCAAEWSLIEEALFSPKESTSGVVQRFRQATGEWADAILDRRSQIREERTHFQRWLAELTTSQRPLAFAPMHDDYHGNNLLAKDGEITALLDWDSCHPDWLVLDVATATWEFCQAEDAAHTLNLDQARSFLQAYADADGTVTQAEFDLIIPFIRCRRMIEAMGSLQGIVTGGDWDNSPDYLLHNLISLENLRGVELK